MDDSTSALIGLAGTLVTVKVVSDVAFKSVKPLSKSKRKKRGMGF